MIGLLPIPNIGSNVKEYDCTAGENIYARQAIINRAPTLPHIFLKGPL